MDTLLYDTSIPLISSLQDKLSDQAQVMQLISTLFDPKYAFLIYSPITYLIDQRVGRKLILTTVIAEWLNMVLKWLLHGERPYWYVHSSGHFEPTETPIKQFPITCELGPGHPSGHAMVTAAVWYIILSSLIQAYCESHLAPLFNRTKQLKLSLWSLYVVLLMTVSVSRVFLACHFPHQCLAGALLGLIVAKCVSKLETSAWHFIAASAFLLASAFGTYALLQALGFDPSWTIKLATKHCEKREYIHLDTAPFFSIMRYCGFALGCGLALLTPPQYSVGGQTQESSQSIAESEQEEEEKDPFGSRNVSMFSVKLLMALLMARLLDNMAGFVSHSSMSLFYSSAFLAYTGFSFAFVNLHH